MIIYNHVIPYKLICHGTTAPRRQQSLPWKTVVHHVTAAYTMRIQFKFLPLFKMKTSADIHAFFKRQLFHFFQLTLKKAVPNSCWHSGVHPHQNNRELECPLVGWLALKVPGTGVPKHIININGVILPTFLGVFITPILQTEN